MGKLETRGILGTLAGMGLGAGLMYLADPNLGNRRRAILRDKFTHWSRQLGDTANKTARDVGNRMQGMVAEWRSSFAKEADLPDRLQARIRSKIGHCVSHPAAIQVDVGPAGAVILSGPIFEHEVADLLSAVASVRGVHTIENRLEPHQTADDVPALQGSGQRRSPTQTTWPPATRLLAGSAGTVLMLNAVRSPGVFNTLLGTAGLALFMRSATNQPVGRMTGVHSTRMIRLGSPQTADIRSRETVSSY